MAPPMQRKLNPFRPFGQIAPNATDYNIILNLGDDDWSLQSEEEDFSYYSGPLSSDAIAVLDLIGQYFEDGEDEPLEFDFFAGPISDDFIIVPDIPYANFDDYDETFEGEEYSFYLGVISDDTPIIPPFIPQGDGDIARHKGVKPTVRIRPKAERDLDEALELVESISETNRVKENKQTAKAALSIVKSIETMEVYKPALEKITKALIKVSRKTAKHEGIEASAAIIAKEIDDLVTAIQARRKRQRKEEEILILWLSNLVNSPFMQLE